MILVSSCSCLRPNHWSQVLSREWRCSRSSADRRCSDYIWLTNKFAYLGTSYIRGFMVFPTKLLIYSHCNINNLGKLFWVGIYQFKIAHWCIIEKIKNLRHQHIKPGIFNFSLANNSSYYLILIKQDQIHIIPRLGLIISFILQFPKFRNIFYCISLPLPLKYLGNISVECRDNSDQHSRKLISTIIFSNINISIIFSNINYIFKHQ